MFIERQLLQNITDGETSLSAVDALGTGSLMKFANETINDLDARLERLNLDRSDNVWGIISQNMRNVLRVNAAERAIAGELEKLAVKLIYQEFGITERDLLLDAKLIPFRPINIQGRANREVPETPVVGKDFLSQEIQKRRVINAFQQGSAHRVQNLFYLAEDEINELSQGLFGLEAEAMAQSNQVYWLLPESTAQGMAEGSIGATEQLDFSTRPITVRARSITFPVLLHELSKGVLEALSLHGLPKVQAEREHVLSIADGFRHEPLDLRLGAGLWVRFNAIFKPGEKELRNLVFRALVELPAKDFLEVVSDLVNADGILLYELKEKVSRGR